MTITEAFKEFLKRLTPSLNESEKVSSHINSIKIRLKKDYNLIKFFKSGSFGNGTSIYGFSDSDYFAVFPEKIKENSKLALELIKKSLIKRFPNTIIYINSPSIVLEFGKTKGYSGEIFEIIPVYIGKKTLDGEFIFRMPDGKTGWIDSIPQLHNKYVTSENKRLKNKLKPLIRFVKAWKYYNDIKIKSFYLEIKITNLMSFNKDINFIRDISIIFENLYKTGLSDLKDPLDCTDDISATKTINIRDKILPKIKKAMFIAKKAYISYEKKEIKKVFELYNELFNNNFPKN